LNAFELDVENLRNRTDHQGLCQTGNTFEETMSAGENCREDLVDYGRLSDDDFAEFILHESAVLPEFLQDVAEISGFM
jgi:hypothetical protein